MKKAVLLVALLGAMLAAAPAQARDDRLNFPLQDALNTPAAKDKIGTDIQLFWGDQTYPKPLQTFSIYTASPKTNAFGKSDQIACNWVLLSALIEMQEHARQEGANAIVDIHSDYEYKDFSSQTQFECGAGSFAAGVTLRGTLVKLP